MFIQTCSTKFFINEQYWQYVVKVPKPVDPCGVEKMYWRLFEK